MTTKIKLGLQIGIALLFAIAWISLPAFADQDEDCQGNPHHCNGGGGNGGEQPPTQEQDQGQAQGQHQGQAQGQGQGQEQATSVEVDASSVSDSTSNNEGITMDASDHSTTNVENNSSNIVLVPNNNTENCLRVFGIAWGKGGESGALGVPWRSKKCDYEQAADDAFAAGERDLGWFWKCQNANLYKSFKPKGVSASAAKIACLTKMNKGSSQTTTINTLRETLTTIERERTIERRLAKESRERITEMCEESKDRLFDACRK